MKQVATPFLILLVVLLYPHHVAFANNLPIVSFSFYQTDIQHALNTLTKMTGLALQSEANLQGTVTVSVDKLPLKKALAELSAVTDFTFLVTGDTLIVTSDTVVAPNNVITQATTPTQTKSQPKPTPITKTVIRTHSIQLTNNHAEYIASSLINQKILPVKGGDVIINKDTNSVLIRGDNTTVNYLTNAIKFLDTQPVNIEIAATIFIANQSTAKSFGTRWGGRVQGNGWQVTGGRLGSLPEDTFVSLGNAPIINYNQQQLPLTVATLGLGSGNSMLDIELALLNSQDKVRILSKPKIKTINNREAIISSGTEIPYQTTDADQKTSVSFRQALLQLRITPYVIDNQTISLVIDVSSNTVGEVYQGLPAIDVNTISTKVILNNNETIVIGGIIRNITKQTESKVPFLGDVPGIGWLFRYQEQSQQKWELMIAITPDISLDTVNEEMLVSPIAKKLRQR